MEVGRLATLRIHALEPMLRGDDIAFIGKFDDNYDPDRFWTSYESLVRQNPGLQVTLKPIGESFSWVPIDPAELNAALDRQRQHFSQIFSLEELLSPAHALTPPLPVRLSQMGDRELCFQMSHTLTNGRGVVQWIMYLLAVANGITVPVCETTGRFESTAPRTGLALLPFYILRYLAKAGRDYAHQTVDLTHGKVPIPHDNGYLSRTYRFSQQETDRVMAKARALDFSLYQYMCLAVAEAMLSAQPDKSRVCIAVPTDLTRYSPDFPRSVPGNYTGSLILQLRRGTPLQAQIAHQFGWLRVGMDYWLNRLVAAFARSERKFVSNFARAASLPIDRRGPFGNHSCLVTNLGDVMTPPDWGIEWGTGTTKSQTIFFGVGTFNGHFFATVTFPHDLYDPAEVFRVAESALARLVNKEALQELREGRFFSSTSD